LHEFVATGPGSARLFAIILGLLACSGPALRAQETDPKLLRAEGFIPTGPRSSVTESPGTLQVTVDNPDTTDKDARVVVFYSARRDVQYARDVWVPAHSSITTWIPIGPAPPAETLQSRQIEMLLYDRTGGAERLVLPPGEQKVRSRAVLYRKREATTAVMFDSVSNPVTGDDNPPYADGVIELIRFVRELPNLSDYVSFVPLGPLPPVPDAFAGIDVFVLAGNRLAQDPPGRAALRHWVEGGGTLWVMLDLVDPGVIAPILGADAPLAVVDRLGLTTIRLSRVPDNPAQAETQEVERPVDLVRVIPTADDRVFYLANGWPAAFTRQLGRGRIVFTTLGDRGWSRPRTAQDPKPTGRGGSAPRPDLPVPLFAVTELATELHPAHTPDPMQPELFKPLLTEEIGYAIIDRPTTAAVLGAFVVVLLCLGLVLRRSRRPELVGWTIPAAAVAAAAFLIALGESSRRAIPPTAGAVALVDPAAGSEEASLTGLYAIYHQTSGPVVLGTRQGALLDLDAEGLEGQLRRRVQLDTDAWRWEGLSLPAGVRTGPFQSTARPGRVTAVARFGPDGIEGRLEAGSYRGPTDALVVPASHEPLPVRFGAGGTFAARTSEALPPGNYIAGAVLDDRQQRRQAVYRQMLSGPLPRHLEGRDLLLAWAEMPELPFPPEEGARVLGSALLAVPLEFERSAPGTRVTVPRGFSTVRRVLDQTRQILVTPSGPEAVTMRVRFQLPASVLPLRVERATAYARVRAPSRTFTLSGAADGKPVRLFEGVGTLDSVRVEITDPRLLEPDELGGLYLTVAFGNTTDPVNSTPWKLESLTLEVVGRTEEAK
jgi:hypothetical protein